MSLLTLIYIYFFIFHKFYNSKLLFIYQHIRHGSRSPMKLDNNNNDFFGYHWDTDGTTTATGNRMAYLLGIISRNKYKDFLLNRYDPREIYITSTWVDRTIITAQCFLTGLYSNIKYSELNNINNDTKKILPPLKNNKQLDEFLNKLEKNISLNNMIIPPIHHYFKSQHYTLLELEVSYSDCPPNNKKQFDLINSNSTQNQIKYFITKFGEGISKFKNISINEVNNYNFVNVLIICDSLLCDLKEMTDLTKINNLENFGINLNEFKEFCSNFALITWNSDIVNKYEDIVFMGESPLFRDLISFMDKRIELDKNNNSDKLEYGKPKYFLYSGHDVSITANMKFMHFIFGYKITPCVFSSNLYIELEKDDNSNNYYINYLLNDELISKINYKEFKEKILKVLWTDEQINNYCNFGIITKFKDKTSLYKKIIFTISLLLIANIFIVIIFKLKNK